MVYAIPRHLGALYVSEYLRGWVARPGALDRAERSHAYEDGYLDRAASRRKWHLAYCTAHHNGEGGCGVA